MDTSAPSNNIKAFPSRLLLIGGLAVLIILVGAYIGLVKPHQDKVQFSKQTLKLIPSIKSDVQKVGDSLEQIYSQVSGQSQPSAGNKQLLRLNIDTFLHQLQAMINKKGLGQVAGVSTAPEDITALDMSVTQVKKVGSELKKSSSFGKKQNTQVLGDTTAYEGTAISQLRRIKEAANSGQMSAQNVQTSTTNLDKLLTTSSIATQSDVKDIVTDLTESNKNASTYIAEAKKTVDYYYKISDIEIKLIPALTSYLTLIQSAAASDNPSIYSDRIREIQRTMNDLYAEVKSIDTASIPKDLLTLHQDNISVIQIIRDNVGDVQVALDAKNFSQFINAVLSLGQNLEPLSTRAKTLELNFWQNDVELKKHTDIVTSYTKSEKALQEVMDKNKLPFLAN